MNLFPMMFVGLIANVEFPDELEWLRTGYIMGSVGAVVLGLSLMVGYALNEITINQRQRLAKDIADELTSRKVEDVR